MYVEERKVVVSVPQVMEKTKVCIDQNQPDMPSREITYEAVERIEVTKFEYVERPELGTLNVTSGWTLGGFKCSCDTRPGYRTVK